MNNYTVKTKDRIVEQVIEKIDQRSLVGQKKYGAMMMEEVIGKKKDLNDFLTDVQEEIMDALQERWSQLEGNWEPQAGDHERQTEFWRQLKSSPEFSKNHGFIHSKARLGDSYLRKNLQFLKT